jgi:hypothetical protein
MRRYIETQREFQKKFTELAEDRVGKGRHQRGFLKEVAKSLDVKQISVVERWVDYHKPCLPGTLHLLTINDRWGITPNEILGIGTKPKPDMELRLKLFFFLVENCPEEKLSEWLSDIGQDIEGTVEEKRARLRQSPNYVLTPVNKFPEKSMTRLNVLSSESLGDLCKILGIDSGGTRDMRYRRIMREIRYCEHWFKKLGPISDATFTLTTVRPYVEWYPIIERGSRERDFYQGFAEEMEEIFGAEFVYPQFQIAPASNLTVDFHLGGQEDKGVGVEFKMPPKKNNNSELQRALGQVAQYKEQYKDNNLLIVLLPDFLSKVGKKHFIKMLSAQGVGVVVK